MVFAADRPSPYRTGASTEGPSTAANKEASGDNDNDNDADSDMQVGDKCSRGQGKTA